HHPICTLFPYTTLFRSGSVYGLRDHHHLPAGIHLCSADGGVHRVVTSCRCALRREHNGLVITPIFRPTPTSLEITNSEDFSKGNDFHERHHLGSGNRDLLRWPSVHRLRPCYHRPWLGHWYPRRQDR